jgi:hypothetical protein
MNDNNNYYYSIDEKKIMMNQISLSTTAIKNLYSLLREEYTNSSFIISNSENKIMVLSEELHEAIMGFEKYVVTFGNVNSSTINLTSHAKNT